MEVSIPDTSPTTMTDFAKQADLNAGSNGTMSLPQTIPRNRHPVTLHQGMTQPYDHLGTTYRLLSQTREDAYAVEVSVRGMSPTTVSGFITQASAERWMAERRHGAVLHSWPLRS